MQPDNRFINDLGEISRALRKRWCWPIPNSEVWDAVCDVLVVGIGLAGVCAALCAAEDERLEVIAIDRSEGGGAASCRAASSTWAAAPGAESRPAWRTRPRTWRTTCR